MPLFNENFDSSIYDRDPALRCRLERVYGARKKLDTAQRHVNEASERVKRAADDWVKVIEALKDEIPKAIARDERRMKVYINKLERENRRLEEEQSKLRQLCGEKEPKEFTSIELEAIAKARTIAIFESVLFAIENWATDDAPASDFTPVAQAVLFKTAYVPVMSGVTDYYMDEVPFASTEVVKRGREYVKALRSQTQTPLTDVSMSLAAQEYQQWWINDALVLLYGDRDPEWETTKPHTLEEMELWKSTDMDKTMHFPKIFDAFELTRKYGDEIRESSGLPEFTKQIMQTRLTSYE